MFLAMSIRCCFHHFQLLTWTDIPSCIFSVRSVPIDLDQHKFLYLRLCNTPQRLFLEQGGRGVLRAIAGKFHARKSSKPCALTACCSHLNVLICATDPSTYFFSKTLLKLCWFQCSQIFQLLSNCQAKVWNRSKPFLVYVSRYLGSWFNRYRTQCNDLLYHAFGLSSLARIVSNSDFSAVIDLHIIVKTAWVSICSDSAFFRSILQFLRF